MASGPRQIAVSRIILTSVLFASEVHSRNLISQIGWKGADSGVIWGVVSILSLSFMLLSLLYVGSRRKVIKDEEELSAKLFEDSCRRVELNEQETEALKTLLTYEDELKPHIIFESIGIFERCVDAHINHLFEQQLSSEKLLEEEIILKSLRNKMGFTFLPPEHPLISTRNISVGQKASVFTQDGKIPLAQNCTVVLMNETGFTIKAQEDQKHKLNLSSGATVLLAFTRQCDGVYSILVKVKDCETIGKPEFYHTLEFSRNQMRQHIRMEVNLPLRFRVLESAGTDEGRVTAQRQASRVVEIGGGGLSFFHNEALRIGDVLALSVQLPDGMVGGIRAKVLRISFLEGKTTSQYKHHVQFLSIDPREREQIVHFIFEKQRQVNQMR
ncbi:MAG: PilZ domain-containing protein [Chitinispirillaceae bacterium]